MTLRGVVFVAWLYLMAASGLFVGAIDFYEWYRFWRHGENANMESKDPAIARAARLGYYDFLWADVTYVTSSGRVDVSRKPLSGDLVKRLAEGRPIPVRFLKNDPYRVLFDGEQPEKPWGWLIAGILALPVALYAHRLLRRQVDEGA